jgi:transposase
MEIRAGKRFRTKQERRQIVEETLQPGASVSVVARAHDVNANQVFHWRKQYGEGWFNETGDRQTALVPVKISSAKDKSLIATCRASKKSARMKGTGSIEIDLGHARVRIEGAADPGCVRATLEGLVR